MNRLREMPFVQVFIVVLVVLFVCGAGLPGNAFARVYMQNGHEGDPEDSYDVIGGGSGDSDDGLDVVGGGATNGSSLLPGEKSVSAQSFVELIILGDGSMVFFVFKNINGTGNLVNGLQALLAGEHVY